MDYCTLSDVKSYATIQRDVADPILTQRLIPAASRRIEKHCRQTFGYEAVSEQVVKAIVRMDGHLYVWPPTPYLVTLTALEYRDLTQGTSWRSADLTRTTITNKPCGTLVTAFGSYDAYRSSALQTRLTGAWGYAEDALPADLVQACVRLVHWYIHQPNAPFGKAGNTLTGEWQVPAAMPPDVVETLSPWARVVP